MARANALALAHTLAKLLNLPTKSIVARAFCSGGDFFTEKTGKSETRWKKGSRRVGIFDNFWFVDKV